MVRAILGFVAGLTEGLGLPFALLMSLQMFGPLAKGTGPVLFALMGKILAPEMRSSYKSFGDATMALSSLAPTTKIPTSCFPR